MKVKDLPNFPKKHIPQSGGGLEFADGFNTAREKIGRLEIEKGIKLLAQAIADSFKEIVK